MSERAAHAATLSDAERAEIEEEIAHLPDRPSACIDALRIVQEHRGWVSDEGVRAIAELLGMSAAEVDGVATFYNLIFRKPVGRHVVMACDSISCHVMGAEPLRAALIARLGVKPGETTPDGRFTLLPIVCIGACDRAPAMMIDDEHVLDVRPESLDGILSRYE
jgi:NADH-quinone oxidoreductase subunit E